MTAPRHRCGSVAILGRPNVGKSTLLNRLLRQKVAVVSPKPETTRERLLGILTLPGAQILLHDTPGIYRSPSTLLGKRQVQAAREALEEADVLLLITEGPAGLTDEDQQIIRLLPKGPAPQTPQRGLPPRPPKGGWPQKGQKGAGPAFLAINKVDRVKKPLLLPQIEQAGRLHPFREIFPISAERGDNVEPLLQALTSALPEGPPLFPADALTDKPLRDLAREIVREKTLLFTHEEIPHAAAVVIEQWRKGLAPPAPHPPGSRQEVADPSTYIRATVYLERDSQKGILIGKGGGRLKRVGEAARKEIEALTGGPVFLDLWVKVAKNWRKDPNMLKRLGY